MKTFKKFNEDVNTIVKKGVQEFGNQNSDIKLGDLFNKETRSQTIKRIKTSGRDIGGKTLINIGKYLQGNNK